jgi:hypothetical protein
MMSVSITRPLATVAVSMVVVVSAHPPSSAGARSLAAAHGGVSPPAESAVRSMPFEAEFVGLDVHHAGLVWRGHIRGIRGDDVTLTIEPLCTPLASAERVWPVRVRWSEEGVSSKVVSLAELEGIVDWKTSRMHVDGTVVEGTAKGRQVTLHAMFRNLDPVGVLSIVSQRVIASRPRGTRAASGATPTPVVRPPTVRQSAAAVQTAVEQQAARPSLNRFNG